MIQRSDGEARSSKQGLYRGIFGLYWDNMGIMEKKVETTISYMEVI